MKTVKKHKQKQKSMHKHYRCSDKVNADDRKKDDLRIYDSYMLQGNYKFKNMYSRKTVQIYLEL